MSSQAQKDYENYIQEIRSKVETPSLGELDLLIAFMLGRENAEGVELVEEQVYQLLKYKYALRFLDRFITISGSNHLTPQTKDKVLAASNPIRVISAINAVAGRTDVNTKIAPFSEVFQNEEFQHRFLAYDSAAFELVVSNLITGLPATIEKMERGLPAKVPESRKNTLCMLYRPESVGKTFISIDLRQANWNSLRYWDNTLPSWEEYIGALLPSEPLIKPLFLSSKMFRQVTLGVALKRLGAIKMVEATQVMLVNRMGSAIIRRLGQPFSESNDELIFGWRQPPGSNLENWVREEVGKYGDLFKITRFHIRSRERDGVFVIDYDEWTTGKQYTLLRCSTPEKIESRLNI